jgi:uncharacterized protein YlzI (FlbEa/FlbD family)
MFSTRSGDRLFLQSLLRAEQDRLEKLRRLENRMLTVLPAGRLAVRGKIDEVMEEIANLSRTIQEYRATHTSAVHLRATTPGFGDGWGTPQEK